MTSSALKIAIIEPVGGHGGMDYYDFGLCEGLSQSEIDVTLFTSDETEVSKGSVFAVKKVYKKIYGKDASWIRAIRYVKGTIQALLICFIQKRTICHFHWFHVGPLELFNILFAKLLRRKVVITAHDVEAFAKGLSVPLFVRFAYNLCDAVIAHNKVSRQELIEKVGISTDKITVIPHGNYLHALGDIPEKAIAREQMMLPVNANIILFFGQIKDVKGLDVLLEAMRSIVTEFPETILLIAGKVWKTDFSKYAQLIEDFEISSNCRTDIRYIPDSEVASYYAAADLVALPYHRIYQSGVLLMAMSYRRPVIVSDLPGMLEVVTNKETGLVFKAGDVNHLADTILSAFRNPQLLNELGENGERLMREHYDWSDIGKAVAGLYLSLND